MCISCFINIFSEYYVNFLCFVWYDTSSFTLLLLVAQTVRHLPAMWETWIRSPGWEDPLEKELATHSSTLAWKSPWMEESGRLQSMGSQRVRLD